MVLRNYSWNEIIETGKKIIFFGAGRVLRRNLERHDDWCLYTEFIVDNNPMKWNTIFEFHGITKAIKSPDSFERIDISKYVIVISGGQGIIWDIYEQLANIENIKNAECCILKFVKVRDDEVAEKMRTYPTSFRITKEPQIPKVIHYCWFGRNPIPEKNKLWMASWKRYCPGYEIIEWNESNYNVSKNTFMEQAYKAGKWGFVSDYARLDLIYKYGGIYLDTDVELIKSLDELLYQEAFAGVDDSNLVSLGLGVGAVPQNNVVKGMLDLYKDLNFDEKHMVAAPTLMKYYFEKVGFKANGELEHINGMTIYPEKVLSGYNNTIGAVRTTEHTFALHHYDGSWNDREKVRKIHLVHELYDRM